ncbi:MAG: cysteine--tRNA ligase [Nitrososphaerota archaeon]|nr:cysteine--tRNA ligase [Nitrososphaerota archaeon]
MPERIKVFNTLSMKKEQFVSMSPGQVRMFVCGPTVNDYMHIGHAKTYVFYDVVARYLRHEGYDVQFAMNVTDIDESIVQVARRSRISVESFVRKYMNYYVEDMKKLGIETLGRFERVSKYIEEMVQQVSGLLSKGYAYRVRNEIFFDVSKFPRFGSLSHMSVPELELRPTELSEDKRNLLDFALWRRPPVDGISFSSPWGEGWPGWHIQDTAYTMSIFGPQYDMHGGARELIYPHHEAEIAQAESLSGLRPFVRYWVHCGLLTTEGRKMSKSEGNVVYSRDILRKYGKNAVRLFLLMQHHRDSFEFDEYTLRRVAGEFQLARENLKQLKQYRGRSSNQKRVHAILAGFFEAMNDDFDTPQAVDLLNTIASEASGAPPGSTKAEDYAGALELAGNIFGVDFIG